MQTPLPHLALVSVHGPDAGTFLQGQLTQDLLSMTAKQARAGGYCSPKGRLLATFVILHPQADTWWLVLRSDLVPALVKRLKMFVLRARCTVEALGDRLVAGAWANDLAPWAVHGDPSTGRYRIGWWGGRALVIEAAAPSVPSVPSVPTAALDQAPNSPERSAFRQWCWDDVQAAWPWVETATADQFVPQMINFELLGGVNFRKGCYPGQEVVARSQYRGTLKRRMALYQLEGGSPAPGTEVFHSEDPAQPAGLVVNAAENPADPSRCALLVEVKIAAQSAGSLHLGAADGPVLQALPLPYRIPLESEI